MVSRDGLGQRRTQADAQMACRRPGRIEVMRQRVAHHFGLLVDFLGHEMGMTGLVHQARRRRW